MSKCTTKRSNLSASGCHCRPLSDINLPKRDKYFENRFVVRSLENFPPRHQATTTTTSTTTTTTTRRKSTTCVCRRCSRSPSPSSRRSDPGQQMFQHLISKRRKPERLLVPDLATEWFRKQKVFLDQVTGRERRAQQKQPLDESLISLSIKCDDSSSHSIQYLNYCQEMKRRKLLLRRQRQMQRDGSPVCRCTDPPNWPPTNKNSIVSNNQNRTSVEQDVKQEKQTRAQSLAKTERNPIKVCPNQMADCHTDSPADKRRSGGASVCPTKPDPLLYPYHKCSCEQRARRRNSCSYIYQADGQPMAKECIAALRTESSLPRLRKKYNLRQAPQRRLDPGRFRRISPQFYSLLKTHEDGITEKFPLYGIPMRYINKTVPCCPCESSVPASTSPCADAAAGASLPNSSSVNADEPCLGDQSAVTEVPKPIVIHERFKECAVPVACSPNKQRCSSTKQYHPKECDGCQGNDCRNNRCDLKPKNSVTNCTKDMCKQLECDYECERSGSTHKFQCSGMPSCDNDTCRNRRNMTINATTATNTTKTTNTQEIRPSNAVKAAELFVEAPKILPDPSKESSAFSRHLEQLRNSFSYTPPPYRPTKRRTPIVDHGGYRDAAGKQDPYPLAKRKGVLGSIAGVCRRAFFPGRYLLYNFSNGFQRHSLYHHKNQTLFGKIKKQKCLLEAEPNPCNYKNNYNYGLFKKKPATKYQFKYGQKRGQYTVNPDGRVDEFRTKSREGDDQYTNIHNEANNQYTVKAIDGENQRVADSVGWNDQYADNHNETNDQYTEKTGADCVGWTNQNTNNSSGRNDQHIPFSGSRDVECTRSKQYAANDQTTYYSGGRIDQYTNNSSGLNDQQIAFSGGRDVECKNHLDERNKEYAANDQTIAYSGERNDQYITDSGIRNEQYTADFEEKNDQYVADSGRMNEQTTAHFGGWNDQYANNSRGWNDQHIAFSGGRDVEYTDHLDGRNKQYAANDQTNSYSGERNDQYTNNSGGRDDQHIAFSGGRDVEYTDYLDGRSKQYEANFGVRNDQTSAYSGGRNDQYIADSGRMNEQSIARSSRRNNQYKSNVGGWSDQFTAPSVRSNDQSTARSGERNDPYITNSGGRNDQSPAHSERRNDQYTARSGGRNDQHMTRSDEENDESSAHSSRRNDQYRTYSSGRDKQYIKDVRNGQSTGYSSRKKNPYQTRYGDKHYQSTVYTGRKKNRQSGETKYHRADPNFRINRYAVGSGVRNISPGVRKNDPPKRQRKPIKQQPLLDSDSTIPQLSADSEKADAQLDDLDARAGYYAAQSSFTDNLSKSDSSATITQVLVNFDDTESKSTAVSEEIADNSHKVGRELKSKTNSVETVSDTTFDSGVTTEIAISTISARPKLKESRMKTPRVNCRRSFTPVSDYQLVMRLMGRKRAKSQSHKRCTVTFVDRKRSKVSPIESNRKQSSLAEHNRNKSRQSVDSTTALRQRSLSRDRPTSSTGMRRSIHKSSRNPTYETQRVHRPRKRTNRVQYADEEEQEIAPTLRYSNDSVASTRQDSRYRHDDQNSNEELEDRKWIKRQRDETEKPSMKREHVTRPIEARPKIRPIGSPALKMVPEPQRENPRQTSSRSIEVSSKLKKPITTTHENYSQGSSMSSQLGQPLKKISRLPTHTNATQRYSTRPLKISSIRMNRRAPREEDLLVEQPVAYSRYNPGVFRRQGRSLSRTISSRSIESSRSNNSDSRQKLMFSISTNDETSLDTIERQEECLDKVTRYTNQTPNNCSVDSGWNSPESDRKKSSPSLLPTIFARKPPPLNEKLVRQREAYASMEQSHKPRTYSPQRMKKQLSLLTRRPAVRVMRSVHQEAAIQEQALRWDRIKRMMKRDKKTQSPSQARQESHSQSESNDDRERYDRPLRIREHYTDHDADLDSVGSRSRSGCDLQFQTDEERRPLNCTLKRKISKGYATPCSSACDLKSHESVSIQKKQTNRSNVQKKSSCSSCDEDEAQSSSFVAQIRQKQKSDSTRFSSGSMEQEVEVDEADEEDKRESQSNSYKSPKHKFASMGYEFLKQAAFGSERAIRMATGSNHFQNTFKRKLSSRAPVPALNSIDNSDRFGGSISYSQSSHRRSSSPGEEQPSRNSESCHRKCHHSGYTNVNRPCPAQLSSILKSPSRHFKSSNEGRRVNFVGSKPSNASIPRPDYHHSVNNGIYTGTCGCSSVSIKAGTRRPSVVRAHTVQGSTEPPIVSKETHSFTFLNRNGSAPSEAPKTTVRKIKPHVPSLFAVPVTPTVDFDDQSSSSEAEKDSSDERLPLADNQEPFDESRLPVNSQLLSKREDYRPKRVPRNDPRIPPPVSLVSDLDFHTHIAATRSMTLGDPREEGGTGSPCPPTAVAAMMEELRIKQNAKLVRAARAAAFRQSQKRTTVTEGKWVYPPAPITAVGLAQQTQRSPYDCIDRTEQPDYYPRRRCWLRRLPEEPVVIAPTHGALREQQVLQRCLPVLFYGRHR